MIRQKHIIVVLILVAFFFFIKGMKSLVGFSANGSDKTAGLSLRDIDLKPFSISDKEIENGRKLLLAKNAQRGGIKLTATAQIANQYDFSEGHNVAAKVAKTDDKAAKKDKKKKKKKKKVSARGKADKKDTDESDKSIIEETDATIADTHDWADSKTSQFVNQIDPVKKEDNQIPITFEDWAKLILGHPQPKNVDKLIEYYKTNLVSAEVFYKILAAMIEENNEEQQSLALHAIDSTPSPRSYAFLIDILKSEHQGSKLAINTSAHLRKYETLSYVYVLKGVFATQLQDEGATQIAVQLLDASTKLYLEDRAPSATSTTSSTSTGANSSTTSSPNNVTIRQQKIFKGFQPLLETVITTYKTNGFIVSTAQRCLARLQNLDVVVADLNR